MIIGFFIGGGGYDEKTDLRLIIFVIISGGDLNRKTIS